MSTTSITVLTCFSELKTEIQKNSDFELEIDGNEAHLKYVELDDEGNSVTRLDENGERVSRMYGLGSFHFENPQDFINKLERVSDNFDTWNCQKNYVSLLLEEEGSLIIIGRMPASRHSTIAAFTSGRTGSIIPERPR